MSRENRDTFLKLVVNLVMVAVATGVLYQKVDGLDQRVSRMEKVFDSVTVEKLGR